MSKFTFLKTNQTLVVPEKREIYVRATDPDLEVIDALKKKVSVCEQDIETKSTKIATLETKVKEFKRATQNASATQAAQYKTKAITLMQEVERIKTEITRRRQTKATLEKQIANYEQVREAQEIQRLLKESNTRMQIALGDMDASEMASIGKEARKADRSANKISDTLLNPFGDDVTEMDNDLLNAFDALELSDEIDTAPIVVASPVVVAPVQKNNNRRREEPDVLDDLF